MEQCFKWLCPAIRRVQKYRGKQWEHIWSIIYISIYLHIYLPAAGTAHLLTFVIKMNDCPFRFSRTVDIWTYFFCRYFFSWWILNGSNVPNPKYCLYDCVAAVLWWMCAVWAIIMCEVTWGQAPLSHSTGPWVIRGRGWDRASTTAENDPSVFTISNGEGSY